LLWYWQYLVLCSPIVDLFLISRCRHNRIPWSKFINANNQHNRIPWSKFINAHNQHLIAPVQILTIIFPYLLSTSCSYILLQGWHSIDSFFQFFPWILLLLWFFQLFWNHKTLQLFYNEKWIACSGCFGLYNTYTTLSIWMIMQV